MRKISDILGKPLISLANATFEGTIIGVLCERRLKSVEYLNILVKNEALDQKKFITVRNVKNIADDAITISNNLCIKTENDVDYAKYAPDPVGSKVYSADGELLGHITDVYINDTTKQIVAILVDGKEIKPDSVASAAADIVVLYEDGAKPVRRTAPRTVKKPKTDAVVEMLADEVAEVTMDVATEETAVTDAYEVAEPTAIEVDIVAQETEVVAEVSPAPEVVTLSDVIVAPAPAVMPKRLISNYRFLLGRVVTANIYDYRKQLLIKSGSLVTAETVLCAHKNNKLIELTLHSKV